MKRKLIHNGLSLLTAVAAMFVALPAQAQEITGTPGSPSATTTISGEQLPAPPGQFGFWIENASVEWKEAEAPFHTVARLTLLRNSQLLREASEAVYFDVTGNSTSDSKPVGSINRARWPAEVASRKARMNKADGGCRR
jgi:hypothetical protein